MTLMPHGREGMRERRRRRFHVHAIRGELLCAARAKNIDRRRDELLAFGMAA
jgi:hypothetical protein